MRNTHQTLDQWEKSKINYAIRVRPLSGADGGSYLAEVPELPGCRADGENQLEALQQAELAIEAWIKTAKENGGEIPEPASYDAFSGKWLIRAPKYLHADLSERAKAEGVSLNALTVAILAKGIGQKQHAA
jgi:antitoxin HicB